MWWLKWRLNAICASSEGSSAHLHRPTLAFVTVQNLSCCLKWRSVCYSRQQRILWWVCTFAQAVTGQCNKNQDPCAGSKGSWEYARLHRLAWAFYKVSKYHVKWRFLQRLCEQRIVVSLHATTGILCNHQCVVQCVKNAPSVVIKILQLNIC